MKRRNRAPAGLSASKRQATDTKPDQEPVWIEGDLPSDDETSITTQIHAATLLLENAERSDRDVDLVRGAVHEFDRILRNVEDEEVLDGVFWAGYGSALAALAEATQGKESLGFLDLAFDFVSAYERKVLVKGEKVDAKVWMALGKIYLSRANVLLRVMKVPDLDEIRGNCAIATRYMKDACDASGHPQDRVKAAALVLAHAELRDDDAGRIGWSRWAYDQYSLVQSDKERWHGMGLAKMCEAQVYMDKLDADEVEQTAIQCDNATSTLREAERSFSKALELYSSSDKEKSQRAAIEVSLAECFMYLGNVSFIAAGRDEDAENADMEQFYAMAEEHVRAAQELGGDIPDALIEFMNDNDSDE